MAAYEFWDEFVAAPAASSYEGFRDRFLSLMPGYYSSPVLARRAMRGRALELFNGFTPEQRIDFNRGTYRPTIEA